MNILAIDCGTKLGWAALVNGHRESGWQEFVVGRGESAGARFLRFRGWLRAMLDEIKPGIVVYEQAHMRGGAATDLLVGMTTRIQEACAEANPPLQYLACHSATLKKFATGSGRADKDDVKQFVVRRWKHQPLDDNESDALALLVWAMEQVGEV